MTVARSTRSHPALLGVFAAASFAPLLAGYHARARFPATAKEHEVRWTDLLTATDRVRGHTAADVQAGLDAELAQRLSSHRDADDGRIADRLDELDREWDIERVLEVNATTITAPGIVASGMSRRRGLLLLPLAVALFLLQHGIRGWCPPLAIFRRRRVRTRREIDLERYSLKALRGDFTGGRRPDLDRVDDLLDTAARR